MFTYLKKFFFLNMYFFLYFSVNLYLRKHNFPFMLPTLNGYQTLKQSIYVSKVHVGGKLAAMQPTKSFF